MSWATDWHDAQIVERFVEILGPLLDSPLEVEVQPSKLVLGAPGLARPLASSSSLVSERAEQQGDQQAARQNALDGARRERLRKLRLGGVHDPPHLAGGELDPPLPHPLLGAMSVPRDSPPRRTGT